jgi:non-canonical (house-cleaning) NTP pyrophosphatase
MQNIFLGTTSQAKLDIVKSLLGENYNVIPINVDSGTTDQPLDEDTTIQGAITRAKRAVNSDQVYEFSVGLEGGLTKINGLYYLVCVAALIDRSSNVYLGISNKLPLPKEVSNKIENGKQFGKIIREFRDKTKETAPSFIEYIQELIDRKKSFSEALTTALFAYKFNNQFVFN